MCITTKLTTFYSTLYQFYNKLSNKQFTQFKTEYHRTVYPTPTLISSPLFVKKPYTTPFTNVQRITLESTIYLAYFLSHSSTTKLTNSEKRMKIMIVNSKIKHKSKTILRVIRNLVLGFILYYVTASMRKYPIHVRAQNTI